MFHKEKENIYDDFYYLNMRELRGFCKKAALDFQGTKSELIAKLIYFIKTGKKMPNASIPAVSKAQHGKEYPLSPEALMVYGSYKNDACTRAFFKQLIGRHFHFTAFGIDWLKMRWLESSPPSYREFATMWSSEYEKRRNEKKQPKKEWAYLSFVQTFLVHNPQASKKEILERWHDVRAQKAKRVMDFFDTLLGE